MKILLPEIDRMLLPAWPKIESVLALTVEGWMPRRRSSARSRLSKQYA